MNQHTASPTQTRRPIASPKRLSQPGALSQAPRLMHARRAAQSPEGTYRYAIGSVADPDADEETLRNLTSRITLRHPELFCLLAVAPDELQAIVDGFLA
jgi:hypothetical protein